MSEALKRYAPADHVVLDAPNWSERDDGAHVRRMDGLTVQRTASKGGGWLVATEDPTETEFFPSKEVGIVNTAEFLRWLDQRAPLPLPEPACGQVWQFGARDEHGAPIEIETMILAIFRNGDALAISTAAGETKWWDLGEIDYPLTLVAGPSSPWAFYPAAPSGVS